MLTATHIRAARALINARQSDLARAAGISLATLNNIERGIGDPRASTLRAIETALAQAGVVIEDSPSHIGVVIQRLSRPRLYEPYQASEAIMAAIGPRALFLASQVVAFGRTDATGGPPRFCVALLGPIRTQIYDRCSLATDTPAGAAEVCGILVAAFAYRRKVLHHVDHLLDDTTQLGDLEVVERLRAARPKPMTHPAQIIDLIDDWARLGVTYASWRSHPARDLLRLFGPEPGKAA
jgi:transcriptional regulator with XRE-family HTH domain